jgi:uncharacterized protein (TIGR03790 family)
MRFKPLLFLAAMVCCAPATTRAQLTADDLLLVVNGNSAASLSVADYYIKARLLPDNRVVKLDLPGSEEIPFDVYERNVVPPIRDHLRRNNLVGRVRCLVTVHGVPIRVAARVISAQEQQEIAEIRTELVAAEKQLAVEVAELENYVRSLQSDFTPAPTAGSPGQGQVFIDSLLRRVDTASRALANRIIALPPADRQAPIDRIKAVFRTLIGEPGVLERFGAADLANPQTSPAVRAEWEKRRDDFLKVRAIVQECNDRRFDPTERARARALVRQHFGLFNFARTLQGHLDYFGTDQSHAALDSELALLWWDYYPRSGWLPNPLYYRAGAGGSQAGPPVLPVARIDGPDANTVRLGILASLRAERDGLKGALVVDSRGIRPGATRPSDEGFAEYDQTLRNLAELARTKTRLKVIHDDNPDVLPEGSVREQVAVYAGWYSVGNYVRCCRWSIGAVGYHIASFEMLTLRDEKNRGWVRNLLLDGIVSTTGPVAEPYLFAFPDADEFFPLLLTGRVTAAEVYWRTQKTVSWQMSFVGDPLYRPFARQPALSPADLPANLAPALAELPRTAPPTPPPTPPPTAPPTAPPTPATSPSPTTDQAATRPSR